MKSVTLALQRNEMDMASARLLFDELLRQTKELDVKRKYIHQNCEIASNKDFENATVKILNGEENALKKQTNFNFHKTEWYTQRTKKNKINQMTKLKTWVQKQRCTTITKHTVYMSKDEMALGTRVKVSDNLEIAYVRNGSTINDFASVM